MSRAIREAQIALGLSVPGKKSRTKAITEHNRDKLAAGVHPATYHPLADNGMTCGDCVFHIERPRPGGSGSYHKCDRHRLGPSRSENSDIRVSWPACMLFHEKR